jgi:hypothetical protein
MAKFNHRSSYPLQPVPSSQSPPTHPLSPILSHQLHTRLAPVPHQRFQSTQFGSYHPIRTRWCASTSRSAEMTNRGGRCRHLSWGLKTRPSESTYHRALVMPQVADTTRNHNWSQGCITLLCETASQAALHVGSRYRAMGGRCGESESQPYCSRSRRTLHLGRMLNLSSCG